jgi:hypothetical protein
MTRIKPSLLALAGWLAAANLLAAVPAVEKLLPEDTLLMITTPDFEAFKAAAVKSPPLRLWQDPAMKPFRDKAAEGFNREFLEPLRRELQADPGLLSGLMRGQVTFAVLQNGWQGEADKSPGFLLLVDTKGQGGLLRTNLAQLRAGWVERGKPLRTERIRELEFMVLPVASNDVPPTLRRFLPRRLEFQELGAKAPAGPPASRGEMILGQADSVLLAANSARVIEQALVRLAGGPLPALEGLAAYQASQAGLFREATAYGWLNIKAYVDIVARQAAANTGERPPTPVETLDLGKLLSSSGFGGVRSLAFSLRLSEEGWLAQVGLGVPEGSRRGLLNLLAGESKEWNPPAFVPADVVEFRRWRLDSKKAVDEMRRLLSEVMPESLGGLKAIFNTAQDAARLEDPALDLEQCFLAGLGDDWVQYKKPLPRGASGAQLEDAPSLTLVGSPEPARLAAGLKWLMVVLSGKPTEREFLGRKIYSVPMPPWQMLWSGATPGRRQQTLHFSPGTSYLALSTDAAFLEEYLRNPEGGVRGLRGLAGLTEAAPKVAGPGTSLFGYVNRLETARAEFEAWRLNSAAATNVLGLGFLPALAGLAQPEKSVEPWLDFSLLPAFDVLARYFHFTVYAGGATPEGVIFKYFAPAPPALRAGETAQR